MREQKEQTVSQSVSEPVSESEAGPGPTHRPTDPPTHDAFGALEEKYAKVRKALVGLVSCETKEDLEAMELVLRAMPGIEKDKIVTINAIHALLDTL